MQRFTSILVLFTAYIIFYSCKNDSVKKEIKTPDILFSNIDNSVNPAQDFFSYSNGGWIKRNPIPSTESSWGIGNLVTDEIRIRLKKVNEKAASLNASPGTDDQKIGDFYASAMDSINLNKMGPNVIKQFIERIDNATNLAQLIQVSAWLTAMNCDNLFSFGISQDARNSAKMQVEFDQGGLGLPNRDYYFNTDSSTTHIRKAYKKYLSQMLSYNLSHNLSSTSTSNLSSNHIFNLSSKGLVAGNSQQKAMEMAEKVFNFEKDLAKVSRKLEDLRDPYANYHKLNTSGFSELIPALKVNDYLGMLGIKRADTVIIGQPEFFTGLNKSLRTVPVDVLKNYFKLNFLKTFAAGISDTLVITKFHFYGTVLSGKKALKPRWKRTLDMEQQVLGMLLGRIYIRDYFSASAKNRYLLMASRVKEALAGRIRNLSWMSAETKEKAMIKIQHITMKVGYPDHWKDYSKLNISRKSLADNLIAAGRFEFNFLLSKYGKPVDRTEWDMSPQTYNAYYNPSNNEIVLPAAMLTIPGKQDAELDDALIYGYVAASTIGHEITHGFDDIGRQFDEKGNLKNWWQKSDETEFKLRATRIIDQFQNFKLSTGQHLNGKASQGENIADLGGILIGLDAFRKTTQYKEGKKIAGLTPLQRFFMGYSLGWLQADRAEYLAMQVLTDVHAPAKYRVNGPLSNVPEFYEAFHIHAGDPMYIESEKRVHIW